MYITIFRTLFSIVGDSSFHLNAVWHNLAPMFYKLKCKMSENEYFFDIKLCRCILIYIQCLCACKYV